jgi:hypothetical protein
MNRRTATDGRAGSRLAIAAPYEVVVSHSCCPPLLSTVASTGHDTKGVSTMVVEPDSSSSAAEPADRKPSKPEWTAERVADLLDELNTGHEFLVYQLDLIAGQRALLSAVVIRQLEHLVTGYRPADAARSQLAALTAEELFAGLEIFAARRAARRTTRQDPPPRLPLFQVHRGGLR